MTSANLKEMIQPVVRDLKAFDHRLNKFLSADSKLISSIIKHIMSARGKRLRPVILFLSTRGGGYTSPKMVDAALAIELIHTATLLHDDVVDESDIRRGQDSVNHRWTNLISVLMGDFLFSRAFGILVGTESQDLIRSISYATERVSYGELRQVEEVANYKLSEKDYLKIISDKTASLFATACEAGPILKKAERRDRKRFYGFGENIGIAFQIADDLLDYVGDARKIGKSIGSDLIQGKVTLPLIYALSKSMPTTRNEITKSLSNGIDKQGINKILKFVTEQGGIDYAYRAAHKYSQRAGNSCDKMKNNIYSKTLKQILDFTVARDN
ncbi:MAG: polyprenyl synthetase family protein [Candidatus Zixiibacteriota bacterium]